MDSKVIYGKDLAQKHEDLLKEKIEKLGIKPRVVSILVGKDPSSILYTQIKKKKAEEVGIDFQSEEFHTGADFSDVALEIERLNKDKSVNAIMVQLPLPTTFLKGHSEKELLEKIDPQKDADGLTGNGKFLPAVVEAIFSIFKDEGISLEGKKAVVVGASDLVGKPVAEEFLKMGVKVEVCDKHTGNLAEKTREADIIVSATGVPGLIRGEMVSEGAIVIDVGAEKVDGKVVGDVNFEEVYPKASRITPVPGGVGPMTVISLMENVVKLVQSS